MTNKNHIKILIAGVAAVLLIVGVIVYSVTYSQTPDTSDETNSSTKGSAWVDETFPNNIVDEDEEHTLPMLTVA